MSSGRQRFSARSSAIFLIAVVVAVCLIYSASLPKRFTNWDDPKYILSNPLIRSVSPASIGRMTTTWYFGNYAPVTLLSWALDVRLWGLDANAFHVHNVLLHLGAVLALYALLGALGLGALPRVIAVLLFALHPVNVETVSWASERKNLLSGVFFLLSFWAYVRYDERGGRRDYGLSLLLFILSVLAKAGTVVTPLVLLAYDHLWNGKKLKEVRWLEKAPFVLVAAVQTYLSILAAASGGAFHSYHPGGWLASLIGTGRLLGSYLYLLLSPTWLTPLITPDSLPKAWDWRLIASFAVLLVGLAAAYRVARRVSFWVFYFVLLMLPVLNIVPLPVVMANRYLYLPEIGLFVLLGLLFERLFTWPSGGRLVKSLVAAAFLVWTAWIAVDAYRWAGCWRDSVSLWSDAVKKQPRNLIARANLGQAYLDEGRRAAAAEEFFTVLAFQPDNSLALLGVAMCELDEGRAERARFFAVKALAGSPRSVLGLRILARSELLRRDFERAIAALVRAHGIDPADNAVLDQLVGALLGSSRPADALAYADLMIRNSPGTYEGYWARGHVLIALRRDREAVPLLERSLSLLREPTGPRQAQIRTALLEARKAPSIPD